jgi:hypothetical protein
MSCPNCQGPSKFQDRRDKTFVSLMGQIVLQRRAYYHCPACHAGHVPLDAALGFSACKLTPAAEELVSLAGTLDSFADAAQKALPKMAGLRLSESTVERTTEAAGERLGDLWAQGRTLGTATDWHWNRDAQGKTIAYVSIDATGVGMQGQGGTRTEGRMAWVGKVFNPRPESNSDRQPKSFAPSARYQAGLMNLDELGARLRAQAGQVGMERAEQWVALTDGGNGLDDFMEVNFPRAVRVLDFYHAAEHLNDFAKIYCGSDLKTAEELSNEWCHQLKHQGGGALLETLYALNLRGRTDAIREAHRRTTLYVWNNLHRTDYPYYREQGWQIGSGHIEAACKTIVNQRLKQSGMRWGTDGADAVCHLRALYEGEDSQWDAFWARSIN